MSEEIIITMEDFVAMSKSHFEFVLLLFPAFPGVGGEVGVFVGGGVAIESVV